jgi:hypothetical protein
MAVLIRLVRPACVPGEGEVSVTVPDYVAIGVLIVLIVWAVADWFPRGKL